MDGRAACLLGADGGWHRRSPGPALAAAIGWADLYKRVRAVPRRRRWARATREQFRAMPLDRVLGDGNRRDGDDGNGCSAAERRAIAEFLTGKTPPPRSTTPAPRHVHPRRRSRRATAGMERLGAEHVEHPVSEHRRPHRRRRAEAEGEVGVRVPRRPAVVLAEHHRGRAHLHRELGRQGLLAERRYRLRPLVLRHRRRRALGHQHRPDQDRHRSALRGVLRRSAGQRLRPGRHDRRADLENARGRLPGGADQRVAHAL